MKPAILILASSLFFIFTAVSAMADAVSYAPPGVVQSPSEVEVTNKILITDVNIFDGNSEKLAMSMSVLIEGNKIAKIAKAIPGSGDMKIIEGGGRTLMPGFMDIHAHLYLNTGALGVLYAPADYHTALSLYEAENTLMRGFTTMRDMAGDLFGVKRAIDEGYFVGPRLYVCGPAISMTAGHGDYRTPMTNPRQQGGTSYSELELLRITVFADGVPEVISASRMNMRSGAAFLKIYAGGAVSGLYDPLDVVEYSFDEVKAAADEAKRWNTYLAVHTYTDAATQIAIKAGAKTLEHCNLIGEETVKMAVKNDCYISAQTGVFLVDAPATPAQKARQQQAADGIDNLLTLCKKHKAKVGFGSDLLMDLEVKKTLNQEFTHRTKWFSNAEILRQATAINGEILALSGPRNPYPGKLGVIEEGALADILLVNGNPLKNIEILTEPEKNLALIMKDGKIYKNTIQ
nr:amidohydrolase family protein [uncultured Desulfobacter sp.]